MLAEQAEDATFGVLADILYYSFPNLEKLNFKAQVVHGLAISPQQIYYSLFYSASYTIAVIFIAILIFRNRDSLICLGEYRTRLILHY